MKSSHSTVFVLSALLAPSLGAETPYPDPCSITEVREFLSVGPGRAHDDAPEAIDQFGRLVGIWDAQLEFRTQDGNWIPGEPALWVWKFALGGFATQDLWVHSEDHLPAYLGERTSANRG
jgi:hypothetical protein